MKKYFIHVFVAILILSSAFPTFSVSALSNPSIIEPEPQILRDEHVRLESDLAEEVKLRLLHRTELIEERVEGAPTTEHTDLTRVQVESFTCTEGMDVPKAECEALVALYNSTNGSGWGLSENWLTGPTVGNWYGVTVTSGFVSQIDLESNHLSGSIPTELGTLTNLEDLNLYGNNLTGIIPAELGNLSKLWSLDLGGNQLSGSIPAEVGNLGMLERLWLGANLLSGTIPAELGNLSTLQSFDLSFGNNQLTGSIPMSFLNLVSLDEFYFIETNLCEPEDGTFEDWKATVESWLGLDTKLICHAPVATADEYSTPEDSELIVTAIEGVLINDTDTDGDALTAELVTTVANGSLILAADGSFTYSPGPDFKGEDSFSYKVFDSVGYSDVITVTIMVNQVSYSIYLPSILK